MTMQLSEKGAAFVRVHEGFVSRWYKDPVGIGTIGTGFTWGSDSFREWWKLNRHDKFGPGARMTRAEADDALRFLVDREYGKAVNEFLKNQRPQHVFDGMVSPVYNLGTGSLQWKWADAARRGDYQRAAALLRNTGTTARGKKLPGLVRRRREEALLIEKGIYTGIGGLMSESVDALADGVLERGEAGQAVAKLIEDLADLGFYDGVRDDVFGFGTEAAVLEFQRVHGLAVDGKAGPITLKAIEEARKMAPDKPWIDDGDPFVNPDLPQPNDKPASGGFFTAIVAFIMKLLGGRK